GGLEREEVIDGAGQGLLGDLVDARLDSDGHQKSLRTTNVARSSSSRVAGPGGMSDRAPRAAAKCWPASPRAHARLPASSRRSAVRAIRSAPRSPFDRNARTSDAAAPP